eukprot:CAMPEP_0197574994 /NCGR_PEP_ID=MMETSP1326-20131121/548_1 /TAXON_ID=1155430 /ORGANISM="Genus nov. species nov., Strain RCC2288" /LENGTH=98 /DNA_ID=CAMNT_0043137681 /DNA_START=150 /DNA_END=446 /DNA_ORIENTATION=+
MTTQPGRAPVALMPGGKTQFRKWGLENLTLPFASRFSSFSTRHDTIRCDDDAMPMPCRARVERDEVRSERAFTLFLMFDDDDVGMLRFDDGLPSALHA